VIAQLTRSPRRAAQLRADLRCGPGEDGTQPKEQQKLILGGSCPVAGRTRHLPPAPADGMKSGARGRRSKLRASRGGRAATTIVCRCLPAAGPGTASACARFSFFVRTRTAAVPAVGGGPQLFMDPSVRPRPRPATVLVG
jgi:hypothetical protein